MRRRSLAPVLVSILSVATPVRADRDGGAAADAGAGAPGTDGAAAPAASGNDAAPAEAASDDAPWRFAFEAGAQVDARPFGVVNLTLRKGPWALRLVTDTLEVELADRGLGGRWWVKLRAQAFASQMLISPWADGEPDPSRALISPHVGAEVGWKRNLPGHLYVGARASARWFWFFAGSDENEGPIPDPTWWVSPELVAGFWRGPDARVWAHGGVDLADGVTAPKVAVEAVWIPDDWVVGPYLEAHAGWARGQNRLTRTRLGGLNPYVVPLAGAGWAEFLVERYAMLRAGPNATWGWGRAAVVVDLATWDGRQEATFAFAGRATWADGWFCDAKLGWAPWLPRRGGAARFSGWLLVGRGLRPL